MLTDRRQQRPRTEWLGHIGGATSRERLHVVAAECIRGHCDDGRVAERRDRSNLARGLIAIDTRKLDIHEDQVRLLPLSKRYALIATNGLEHLIIHTRQEIAENASVVLL